MPSVSYSETQSFLRCKRSHYYGYTRSLQRAEAGNGGKDLGSHGHAILEAFYQTILDSGDTLGKQRKAIPAALAAARQAYDIALTTYVEPGGTKATLEEILFGYYFPNEPYVGKLLIQAVEWSGKLKLEVEGELIETPFVVDLVGVDSVGKTVLIDHKFLYDFYTDEDIQTMPQLALYLATLRGLGHKVDYAAYNMLRTRAIRGTKAKDGTYPGATWEQRRQELVSRPNTTQVTRAFMEQIDTTRELLEAKTWDAEKQDLRAHRVGQKMTCKNCDFKELCVTELTGGNTTMLLKNAYKIRERRVFEDSEDAEEVSA